jgi:TonB family protein
MAWLSQPAELAGQRTRIGSIDTVPNGGMLPPQIVSYTVPSYTPEAIARRIEGTVTVEASSDAAGNIQVLRVVRALGYGLDESALLALRDWKFVPALRNGAPVAAITQIDIDFKLPRNTSFQVNLKKLKK